MLPSLFPSWSPDYLGRQLLNQPILVYTLYFSTHDFFVFYLASITPQRFYMLLYLSAALADPVLVPVPVPVPVAVSATSPVSVPAPVSVSISCLSLCFHSYSRSRSRPVTITVHVPIRTPDPARVSIPISDPVHSFPRVGPNHLSVLFGCTDIGPYQRSFWVPASTILCLQR